jgi:hypothetical protein
MLWWRGLQIVLDRIEEFWETDLEGYVISSPEFCEFKLFHYFTDYFWHNRTLSQKFNQKRNACYFNPGVMLFDTVREALATCAEPGGRVTTRQVGYHQLL